MADVTEAIGERLDLLLTLVTDSWASLPEVARMIDTWDPADQAQFVVEWPIQEQRLCRLQAYAARGALSSAQHARYERLQEIVTANRPLLARILEP